MDPGYAKLIKIMYDQTYQSLKMNDSLGRTFKTSRGVSQGCINKAQTVVISKGLRASFIISKRVGPISKPSTSIRKGY